MSLLLTGAGGMLGHDLRRALAARPHTALTRSDLDVTDLDAVRRAVVGHTVVVNAAAYTKVDDAETDEATARDINAVGAENLAIAAAEVGATIVQVSTDYVFRGDATTPYAEDAERGPVSAYGRTKAEGEERVIAANPKHYVVRTAWLYGAGGPNFAATMLSLAEKRPTLTVVDDQRGQPTWTADLADRILALVDSDAPFGVYHGTSSGETTWFGFARAVYEEAGLDPERIQPTDSSAFVRPAPRPSYSVLGHDAWVRAGIDPIPDWRDALARASADGVLAR